MNENSFEVLSALVDGETVEAEALAAALERPGAREALVDFVRIRAAVENDSSHPSDAFYARIRRHLPELDRSSTSRRGRAALWAAATALAVLISVGAYLMSPPRADTEPTPVPKPTRVLSFEPGVDWEAR